MKKIIYFLLSIAVASLLLVGCISNKDSEAEAIVKDFATKMYTLEDYKKVDMEKVKLEYQKYQYTNEIMEISTEKALEEFIADRTIGIYINRLCELHVNSKVTSISMDKNSSEDDGSIIYDYKVKVKLTFADTSKEKEEELLGQITVKKVEDKWVITQFNKVPLPIEIIKK